MRQPGSVRVCSVRVNTGKAYSGGECIRSRLVTENGQRRDGKRALRHRLPSRKRKCRSGKELGQGREAYRHHKTAPRPPPARQRIHVIPVPGFFHPLGRQRFSRCFPLPRHAPSPCRPMTYMACCKVCCGCKECDEGEEGKCCCGNECCAADTYCCNAECVSACSEGQEGDCKCSDACCYQDEYCCAGECVEACGEGDAGPCKCSSDCCAEGEYCCDGSCQAEPCGAPCDTYDDCGANECCEGGECVPHEGDPALEPTVPSTCPDGELQCPAGCCPEGSFVCCPDNLSCAVHICDCPNPLP